MPEIEDQLDSWLGLGPEQKKGQKPKQRPVDKLDVQKAVDFMEKGTMAESQLALGLLGISHHARELLAGGLTNDALFTLIEAKSKRYRNGSRVSQEGIRIVLEACAELSEFVDQEALERVRAARAKR